MVRPEGLLRQSDTGAARIPQRMVSLPVGAAELTHALGVHEWKWHALALAVALVLVVAILLSRPRERSCDCGS